MSPAFSEWPGLMWAGDRPVISVITIFLNAERFIEEAIASVLSQDYADLELILVDDGSGAVCSRLAESYAERFAPFVRYVDHPGHENRGMSASRNLGCACARGDFIAFIDADDVWERGKLREQLAILAAHPEVGMVAGAVRYWSSWEGGVDKVVLTGHVQDRVINPPEATLELYPLGVAPAPCPSDLLLRREVLAQVGGFEEHFTGPNQMYEDQAFFAKVYLLTPIYLSRQVWLHYRQHSGSCVSEVTRDGRYHEVRGYFLDWLDEYVRSHRCPPEVKSALRKARLRYTHPRLQRVRELLHTANRRWRRAASLAQTLLGRGRA